MPVKPDPIRPVRWLKVAGAIVLLAMLPTVLAQDPLTLHADSTMERVVLMDTSDVISDAQPRLQPDQPVLDIAWLARADSLWWAWCEEAHCLSTDSAIWYAGTASKDLASQLDTAAILRDLADLDRRSSLDLAPHGAVLDRIAFMMRRRPIFLGRMMGRGLQYFPLFEEALDRHGLPLELKYLPGGEDASFT